MSDEALARRDREGLFELAAAFTGSAARLGLTVVSAPLILLPVQSRRRVRRALAEVARAVVALPKELTTVSVRVVDEMFEGAASGSGTGTRRSDTIAERARNFSDRLSRAADEFSASIGRATNRAADNAEKAAAKVDEWVEKP